MDFGGSQGLFPKPLHEHGNVLVQRFSLGYESQKVTGGARLIPINSSPWWQLAQDLTSHPELLLKGKAGGDFGCWSPCKGRDALGSAWGWVPTARAGDPGVHGMQLCGQHHSAPQLAPRGISAWCQLCHHHHPWDDSPWFPQRKAWPHSHKGIDSWGHCMNWQLPLSCLSSPARSTGGSFPACDKIQASLRKWLPLLCQ